MVQLGRTEVGRDVWPNLRPGTSWPKFQPPPAGRPAVCLPPWQPQSVPRSHSQPPATPRRWLPLSLAAAAAAACHCHRPRLRRSLPPHRPCTRPAHAPAAGPRCGPASTPPPWLAATVAGSLCPSPHGSIWLASAPPSAASSPVAQPWLGRPAVPSPACSRRPDPGSLSRRCPSAAATATPASRAWPPPVGRGSAPAPPPPASRTAPTPCSTVSVAMAVVLGAAGRQQITFVVRLRL